MARKKSKRGTKKMNRIAKRAKRSVKASKKVTPLRKVLKISAKFNKELAGESKAIQKKVAKLRASKEKDKRFTEHISCDDCSTERRVMPQDKFHVTRCELHQILDKRERATKRMAKYRKGLKAA